MTTFQFTLLAREWLLGISLLLFVLVFVAILASHWHHYKHAEVRFHASSVTEMAWSLAPMLMVLATGVAGVSSVMAF